MGHAMQVVGRMDPRHWLHVPQKRTVLSIALGIVMLLAIAALLSGVDFRPAAVPAPVPAPAVVETAPSVTPAVEAAPAPAAVKRVVVKIEEPLVIYGTVTR
jgi:hypothetical protein